MFGLKFSNKEVPENEYIFKGPFWDGFRQGAKWFIVPTIIVTLYAIYLVAH